MASISEFRSQRLWPVLGLLMLCVLIPTLCVLWFMNEAVRNERLAVRQRLIEVYRSQVEQVRERLDVHWRERLALLPAFDPQPDPAVQFQALVRSEACDSLLLYTPAGDIRYPLTAGITEEEAYEESEQNMEWQWAEWLEHVQQDPAAAARVYENIAARTPDVQLAARVLQAQARCLLRSGEKEAAVHILLDRLGEDQFLHAVDADGRSISASAALLGLQLLAQSQAPGFREAADRLVQWLNDYEGFRMPSTQRLFLMEHLLELDPDSRPLPMLAAERLAARYLETARQPPAAGILGQTGDLWHLASPDATAVALYDGRRTRAEMQALIAESASFAGADLGLVPMSGSAQRKNVILSMPAATVLPGWELVLTEGEGSPFAAAADRRIASYLWIAVLATLSTILFTGLLARYVGRQVRLTRLKNDLIATVSHELKTPLASIRALVDTLLERNGQDPQQAREYLELIARENTRLSRLIDNFLAFSRMERDRHAFKYDRCSPHSLANTACESISDRFAAADCTLELDVAADLPEILADSDALVTVLLNLLDNAYKYTGSTKRITLRARADNGAVCFEVQDNGIGLSRREVRKVFDRFYQVDQSLSRRSGGCGLGLSIVQFIVRAHGGSVHVQSSPGQGSTFTVRIPARAVATPEVPA